MDQTLLQGVVFESFTNDPHSMYAMSLGQNCDPAPVLDGAVSFLGNWTARIYNPYSKWVSGVGSAFEKQASPYLLASTASTGAAKASTCCP